MTARRAWLLALAGCACNGQGAALAEGFGAAMAAAAMVLLALLVVTVLLYLLTWSQLVKSMRGALKGDAAAALRGWTWALVVTLIHAGAILLFSQWRFGDGPEASMLVLAGFVPLGVLTVMAALAARRGRWWPLAPTAAMVLYTASLALENWYVWPLAELPGRVMQLSDSSLHTCARLSTGQVACVGANYQGQRGDGSVHGNDAPTLVRGLHDAKEIFSADSLSCVIRAEHPPACWGGRDELPVPGARERLWELPGAAGAVALAPATRTIVWMGQDGALGGWPEPPPEGVTRARVLVGDDDFDGAWICVLGETDELGCWPENRRQPRTVRRFAAPAAVALAVDADSEEACVADERGTVRCFNLDQERETRTLEVPGLEQLLAVDNKGTFCARSGRRIICWRDDGLPEVPSGFARAESVFAGAGMLCGTVGEALHCVTPGTQRPPQAEELVARDRRP